MFSVGEFVVSSLGVCVRLVGDFDLIHSRNVTFNRNLTIKGMRITGKTN